MGMSLEFGIKKKRAAQAALNEEILYHLEFGAVRALSLELVGNEKTTMLNASILYKDRSARLSLADLRVLNKSERKAITGKEGNEASDALNAHLSAEAARLEFSDLALLQAFKVDDSGDEFIKVGNTSAIRTPVVRQPYLNVPLTVDVDPATPRQKLRFSKSQRVFLITL